MRRPRFKRWIREEVLAAAGADTFSLRKFAAAAQRDGNSLLGSALLLYAHENGQTGRLMSLVYVDALAQEYREVEARLGSRSVERLALRGTPMMSLPESYRSLLAKYDEAYHAPERIAAEKKALWERTRRAVLVNGSSPAEIARALGLDPSNTSAYLARADTGRFTLATVRAISDYVRETPYAPSRSAGHSRGNDCGTACSTARFAGA